MAKWMMALLNDGKNSRGVRVLREGVVEEMFTAQNVYPPPSYAANYRRPVTPESFSGDTYGLGWKIGYYKGVLWSTCTRTRTRTHSHTHAHTHLWIA